MRDSTFVQWRFCATETTMTVEFRTGDVAMNIEIDVDNEKCVLRTGPGVLRVGSDGGVSFTYQEAVEFHARLGRAIQQADKEWPKEWRSI
jgi:hypothetical protein